MNILSNAIDATEQKTGDSVLLTGNHSQSRIADPEFLTPQIRITTECSNQQVIIRIADNGQGIPEKEQKHLFDPFFTTKAVSKGTDLGLSISYQIITEKHQGKLLCISSPGNGAEFVICIPSKAAGMGRGGDGEVGGFGVPQSGLGGSGGRGENK